MTENDNLQVLRDDDITVNLKPGNCYKKYSTSVVPKIGQWVIWKGVATDSSK